MFVPTQLRYRLRSQGDINFNISRRRTKLADRSMAVVGPKWWNNLPSYLKNIQSESSFRSKLKHICIVSFMNNECALVKYKIPVAI